MTIVARRRKNRRTNEVPALRLSSRQKALLPRRLRTVLTLLLSTKTFFIEVSDSVNPIFTHFDHLIWPPNVSCLVRRNISSHRGCGTDSFHSPAAAAFLFLKKKHRHLAPADSKPVLSNSSSFRPLVRLCHRETSSSPRGATLWPCSIAFDRLRRNAKHFSGLLYGEPAEETQFYDLALPGVELR
jgi:hypothetical protein